MRAPSRQIVGFALLFIIAVSAYLTIVQIVDAFKPDGILTSFSVKSMRRPGSSGKFLMGDTLVVEAKSSVATGYDLQVRVNSSTVFESERPGGSQLRLEVPLAPPAFTVGKSYTLGLNGFVTNSPILGAYFADSASYTFDVGGTQTALGLSSTYDNSTNWLYSCANLTDVDGYPIANETVGFCLQLKSEHPLTDGWIPLGSTVTDSNGTAMLSLGFPLFCQMAVKACHEGNANFGPSEKTADIEETSNFTESFLYLPQQTLSEGSTREMGILDTGTVNMTMITGSPYALVPVNVTTTYTSNSLLNDTYSTLVVYYLDNLSGCVGGSPPLVLLPGGPPYVYQITWPWPQGPNATLGNHSLIGGVVPCPNGAKDLSVACRNGTGIVSSGNIAINITACPSNLVLHLPDATYGNVLPVNVAFTRPWPYGANGAGGFTACSLAPQFVYDGVNYAVDEPISTSVSISLFVNGTLSGTNATDANGLASFQYPLSFSGTCSNLNINCTTNCSGLPFQQVNVTRAVTLTNITVNDTATVGNGCFLLNCTVNGQGATAGLGNGTIYVGAENQVDLNAALSASPMQGAPASVLIGKPIARACTNSSGWVSAPNGTLMLRVASLYNMSATNGLASADINHDGKIDGQDIVIVAKSFGSFPGCAPPLLWNWRADINFDMKVDGKDVGTCARYFGTVVTYVNVTDYSIVNVTYLLNNTSNNMMLNSSGCVSVPAGVSCLSFSVGGSQVGAVVEFFSSDFHEDCRTDSGGAASASWTPAATASYFALAWLPSKFQAVISQWSNSTNVQDPLSVATYLNVVKRPIDMSVDFVPKQPTLDDMVNMSAACFDVGLGEPAKGLDVGFYLSDLNGSYIFMGHHMTNDSGVAVFSWSPRYYYSQYHLLAYFVVRVACNETGFTQMVEVVPVPVDTRYPTQLQFLGNPVQHVATGAGYNLAFNLTRSDTGAPVSRQYFNVYMNGTGPTQCYAGDYGNSSVPWNFSQTGIYYFQASFPGDISYIYRPSNETRFVFVASFVPTVVIFDVQPHEFKPDTDIMLIATVLNATSQLPLPSFPVSFYEVRADGTCPMIGGNGITTNASGVATLAWHYNPSGVYAYNVSVATGQMMTSPVTLTVAKETALTLDVSLNSDYNHTISGCLLSDGQPVIDKPLQIYVNNALRANLTTGDPSGNFSLTLDLPAVSNAATTYNVQATFAGDGPCNASAYATTPNGTQYAVCTTIQYGYKPSSNSSCLTVKPQATQVMTTTKTMEQMQQEAKDSGSLSVYSEWSWWYPWYRLHFVGKCNDPITLIDVGVAALPFADTGYLPDTAFKGKVNEWLGKIVFNVVTGIVATEFALWAASNLGPIYFGLVLLGYIAYKAVSLFGLSWNSVESLYISLVSTVVSTAISAWTGLCSFLPRSLQALAAGAESIKNMAFAFLCKIIMIPVNIWLLMTTWNRIVELGGA